MQQIPFIDLFKTALHVSVDKLAYPQEHYLTLYTVFGTMHRYCCRQGQQPYRFMFLITQCQFTTNNFQVLCLTSRSVNLQQRIFRFYAYHHVVSIYNNEFSGVMFVITQCQFTTKNFRFCVYHHVVSIYNKEFSGFMFVITQCQFTTKHFPVLCLSSRSVNLHKRIFRFYVYHHVVPMYNKEFSGFMFVITQFQLTTTNFEVLCL